MVAWIAGIIDAFNNFNALRGWIVLGLPLSYVVILFPVRVVSRVGIHVCKLAGRLRDRFDAIRAAH